MEENLLGKRKEIIETCLWLKKEGYVFGTWGNISVRVDTETFLITPSRIPYEEMQPEDILLMNLDGKVLEGTRLPTSERELHRGILKARPDIMAIVHTHSTYAIAAGTLGCDIPPISEEICQLLGGRIPVTSNFVASEKHVELGEECVRSIGSYNALLIRNHGAVACGRSLSEAVVSCQVVEKSAQIFVSIYNKDFNCVPEPWVEAGRNYFLYSYGKT